MTADDKPSIDRAGETVRTTASNERPFDMWLRKQLHAMYDEIASEPLPDELLKLIDRADSDASKTLNNATADPPNTK